MLGDLINAIIAAIDEDKLPLDDLQALGRALGRHCRTKFAKMKTLPTRLDDLKIKSYDVVWNSETNEEWKSFLASLCGVR